MPQSSVRAAYRVHAVIVMALHISPQQCIRNRMYCTSRCTCAEARAHVFLKGEGVLQCRDLVGELRFELTLYLRAPTSAD
jgi:hypothetical protein